MTKIGLSFDGFYPIGVSVDIARQGVAAGATSLWVAEHLGYRDPMTSAMALAGACPGVTVVPTAISPYLHKPMPVAMAMATLSESNGGHVALAIGTGNPMFLAESGLEIVKPLRAIREQTEALRDLFGGEPVTRDAMLFQLNNARLAFRPAKPVPIYFCPMKEQMLRLSGKIADGLCLSGGLSAGFVRESLDIAEAGAHEAGRDPSALHKAGYVYFLASGTSKGGFDTLKSKLAFLMRNLFISDNIAHSGLPIDQEAIMDAISRRDFDTAKSLVPDEAVEAFSITGTVDDCRAGIERYAAAGLDEVVLIMAGEAEEREIGYDVIRRVTGKL
jgi:5,10-methylenetetrahydromethanopterin reductase